jgi:hypothetical protein
VGVRRREHRAEIRATFLGIPANCFSLAILLPRMHLL